MWLVNWKVKVIRQQPKTCEEGKAETAEVAPEDDYLVTVCAACEQASCWYAEFMCQESRSAGIKQMKRSELAAKRLENPCYWTKEAIENGGTVQRQHVIGSAKHAFD